VCTLHYQVAPALTSGTAKCSNQYTRCQALGTAPSRLCVPKTDPIPSHRPAECCEQHCAMACWCLEQLTAGCRWTRAADDTCPIRTPNTADPQQIYDVQSVTSPASGFGASLRLHTEGSPAKRWNCRYLAGPHKRCLVAIKYCLKAHFGTKQVEGGSTLVHKLILLNC
jgi:hypothetical protein